MPDLILLTTCIDERSIHALLESVVSCNSKVDIRMICVAQNGCRIVAPVSNHFILDVLKVDTVIPLSQARNLAIRYVRDTGIQGRYVMFPDDDTLFDNNFFETFEMRVQGSTIIDVYGTGTNTLFKRILHKQNDRLCERDYAAAMSVNMIIDYDVFAKTGYFDERLGVGAPYGSGEDVDYYIRCCRHAPTGFRYERNLYNYHPLPDDKYRTMTFRMLAKRYRNYGRGMIYLFCKHRMYIPAVKCICSGAAGAILAFFKGNFKLAGARAYAAGVRLITFFQLMGTKDF